VLLGAFVDIAPHFGGEILILGGEKNVFKPNGQNTVIETTASILTKFGITIETTKWSSWVVPTSAQQIQDGGRPPLLNS